MIDIFRCPVGMHSFILSIPEAIIKRAPGYKDAGANGVFIAEPTAGIMNPKMLAGLIL